MYITVATAGWVIYNMQQLLYDVIVSITHYCGVCQIDTQSYIMYCDWLFYTTKRKCLFDTIIHLDVKLHLDQQL